MKLKITKGATVEVIAGGDKGKSGPVMEVNPLKMKIKVQGIKIQTHYDKKEGLQKKEGFIDYSNVRLLEKPAVKEKKTAKKKTSARK